MAWTEDEYSAFLSDRGKAQLEAAAPKKSKMRNVKCVSDDGITFDSKREATYWHELKLREKAGEISGLRRQVRFPLYAPVVDERGIASTCTIVQVSEYRADYVYFDEPSRVAHVVDAKGHRTKEYLRSKKWLELQSGIVIEEV